LDFIVALIITVTALLLVFTPVPEAVAGVALMYAMQMASQLQWFGIPLSHPFLYLRLSF